MVKRNLPRVALALPVLGQERNASGDEVFMRHLRIRRFHVQIVVDQVTTRELVLKEQETTRRIRQQQMNKVQLALLNRYCS